ncbi:MAG: PEP-CTERM sorting domain-containing protein [Myxococcota bacterium]
MRFCHIRSFSLATAAIAALLFCSSSAGATALAEWNFNDGTAEDLLGNYDLTAIGGGPAIAGGYAQFSGDEGTPSYLESTGFGGNPTWSLALRLRADGPVDQGSFQGIFSNNFSPSADYSWQVENFGGVYQLRTTTGTFVIGAPTGDFDTIVVRKLSGSDADIWFNGVNVVASIGSNPGGLQNFRIGTNRNSSSFYAFTLDTVRVYDSVEDPLTIIPEPGSALLLGLGLAGLAVRRRKMAPRARERSA